jgi:hypothetical protein
MTFNYLSYHIYSKKIIAAHTKKATQIKPITLMISIPDINPIPVIKSERTPNKTAILVSRHITLSSKSTAGYQQINPEISSTNLSLLIFYSISLFN